MKDPLKCNCVRCKEREKKMDWISVKDRLPEKGEPVGYVTDGSMISHEIEYSHEEKKWYTMTWRGPLAIEVTHWMPLPEPPKE